MGFSCEAVFRPGTRRAAHRLGAGLLRLNPNSEVELAFSGQPVESDLPALINLENGTAVWIFRKSPLTRPDPAEESADCGPPSPQGRGPSTLIDFSPLPWGEGGESSEPGEGFRPAKFRNFGI